MRDGVRAFIFGPGLPPAGTYGTLAISIMGAEIAAGGRSQRAPLNSITVREVGFETAGLEVAWQDLDGIWAAHVLDPAAARRLLTESALAGTPQAATLVARQRKTGVTRSFGQVALALLLALPVILLILFLLSASTIAGWLAGRVPVHHEIAIGRTAFESMRSGLSLQNDGPAYETSRSIVARLTPSSRFQYDVHIVRDDSPNASALPGGIIVVHTGLIAATKSAEELAGVLAHEVQHVELRHSLRRVIKDMGLRGLWAFVTGDLGGSIAGQAALELTSLQFSRDDEREADARGFDALVAAGINPAGMPAFFTTLGQITGSQVPAFLSTHPLSEERDLALRQRLDTVAKQTFQPLGIQPWPPAVQVPQNVR
jgi:Zn-dependent protease with chaperone function